MSARVAVGLVGVLLSAGAGSAVERATTLAQAITLALENNEDIVVERESVATADAAVGAARGAYDPHLQLDLELQQATPPVNSAFSGAPAGDAAPTLETVGGGAALRQLLPTGGELALRTSASRVTTDGGFELLSPAYWSQFGVELRQALLRGRAVDGARLALKVSAADRSGAVASLLREVSDTVAAVERAYWSLAELRRSVGVREEAVRLAEEQLSETGARIEGGAAPETEIAQPRAEVERRRGELLAAREAVARAGNALKLLILSDDDAELWAAELVPSDPVEAELAEVDVAAAMERALASRTELDMVRSLLDRRSAEVAFARDGTRPRLDAVLSYDRFGLSGSRNPAAATLPGLPAEVPAGLEGSWSQSYEVMGEGDFDDARVALVLGIPIGNRVARADLAAAESARRQAEAELARARKAIRAEVLDAAAALETAAQRIEAARASREAAEVQLEAERERYSVGLSINFLVLTRQNDLSEARLAEIAALTDYRTAIVELARATGTLLDERGISVVEEAG